MTNINKTIEKFKEEFREDYKIIYKGILPDSFLEQGNSWFEAFIIKALKDQEQEHQKKLEELKRLCDKERRGFLKTIERLKK